MANICRYCDAEVLAPNELLDTDENDIIEYKSYEYVKLHFNRHIFPLVRALKTVELFCTVNTYVIVSHRYEVETNP